MKTAMNTRIEMDAQVFLRIAKHAKQNFPAAASGSLLGLDVKGDANTHPGLRVTNCFAFKQGAETDARAEAFTEYQYDMLSALGEVRVDANSVGWYESTHHGNFLNETLIENQYQFQKEVPSGVVIIYDPFQQKIGKCGFSAYRLTDAAMKRCAQKEHSEVGVDPFSNFSSNELLEQVPITLHCSPWAETLLLQTSKSSFDALDTDNMSAALEKNVQMLVESLEDFSLHQRELQMFERQSRKQQEQISKNQRIPKAVDTLNLSRQIQNHCGSIDNYASESLAKLYLVSTPENSAAISSTMTNLRGAMQGGA